MLKALLLLISLLLTFTKLYAFETEAKYAFMIDYDSGEVLFEKNGDVPTTPSSMSKLMTIYMVFDQLKKKSISLDTTLSISEKAWKMQGSKMFLKSGDRVAIDDLLKGMIIQSGNDACIVVAEGLMGDEGEFAKVMNSKAKELGLTSSHFLNATGWPDKGHEMSSRDIAILSAAIIRDFPEYYHYFSQKEYQYNGIKQQNRNMLLGRYVGVDGLKTGHTDIAGYGIALSAKRDDRRIILVVNGLIGTILRANESEKLLNYGFLGFENIKFAEKHKSFAEIKINNGKKKTVALMSNENIIITVPKIDKANVSSEIIYNEKLSAPVKSGQELAELIIKTPKKEMRYMLYAASDVEELSFIGKMIVRIKNMISVE
jgi:serine-type D-Ala-D-Ala carboxypeptidase (penicillin-binding protein 5/6)